MKLVPERVVVVCVGGNSHTLRHFSRIRPQGWGINSGKLDGRVRGNSAKERGRGKCWRA
jgi:hypothetical protein